MADISVTLTLDDSQFQTILKRVDTNTQQFGTKFTKIVNDLNTSIKTLTGVIGTLGTKFDELSKQIDAATQSLAANKARLDTGATSANTMGSGIATLTNQFSSLATAIVGASLTGFISNAVSAAATTVRMSEALGISTQAFMTLSAGATAAGKDQDSLGRAMLRMEATAQQANDGSARLKSAYHELGLSMEDLHKLSPDQAFLAIAKALATMEDPGKRAELTMMTLGRDAKTIDWKAFVAGAEASAGKMNEHARSTEDAAKAYRAVQAGLQELKRNILDLLDPLLKLIGDNAQGFLGAKFAAEAFLAVLSVTAIMGAVRAITLLTEAIAALGSTLFAAGAFLGGLKLGTIVASFTSFITKVMEARAAIAALGEITAVVAGVAVTLSFPIEVVVAVIGALIAAVLGLGVVLYKAFGSEILSGIGKFFTTIGGWISNFASDIYNKFGKATDYAADKLRGLFGMRPKAFDEGAGGGRGGQGGATAEQANPLLTTPTYDPGIARAQALTNRLELMRAENKLAVDRLDKERELVGATEDVRKAGLAEFDVKRKAAIEELRIRGQIRVLELENKNPQALGEKTAEIEALRQELGLYAGQAAAISSRTKALIQEQTTRKFGLEFAKEDADLQARIKELTAQAAQVGKDATENNIAALEKQKEVTMAAWAEKQKLYGTGDIKAFQAGLKKIVEDYNQLEDAQRKLNDAKVAYSIKKLFNEEDLKVGKELITLQNSINELHMSSDEKVIANIYKKRDIESEAMIKNIEQLKGQKLSVEEVNAVLSEMDSKYAPIIARQEELTKQSTSFSVGFQQAWLDYATNATNAATAAKDAFGAVTKNMDSMLSDFVKTGKLNFGDFARSVIQDLELIALKMAAANMFKAVGVASGFSLAGIATMLGFAQGGVVPNDQPVLVGENGPEIIAGVGGRTIIPNSQMTSAMGNMGGDTNITHNYNISAIDSKSVAQMFYENRMTMFGMTEQARREMPMRNR